MAKKEVKKETKKAEPKKEVKVANLWDHLKRLSWIFQ